VQISFEVPSARAVPIPLNRGNPAVLAEAGAEFSTAVKKMAKTLVGTAAPAPKKAQRRLFALGKA
jgi:Flp pilus assembly CpaE family ATPase